MNRHHQQAFQQFQYLTLPLHVHGDHIERAWTEANQRVAERLDPKPDDEQE